MIKIVAKSVFGIFMVIGWMFISTEIFDIFNIKSVLEFAGWCMTTSIILDIFTFLNYPRFHLKRSTKGLNIAGKELMRNINI